MVRCRNLTTTPGSHVNYLKPYYTCDSGVCGSITDSILSLLASVGSTTSTVREALKEGKACLAASAKKCRSFVGSLESHTFIGGVLENGKFWNLGNTI